MCGIVGKYYFRADLYRSDDLENMMRSIYHRGPDESGKFIDQRVALGFRRLSIIDTVSGSQPLYNEAKDILAFANGEIYNFKELRLLLESKGHSFRTNSDCEVLVHLYEEYGRDFLPMLNGMFAFCIYDIKRKSLLITRDRIGIKPLYYYKNNDIFVFGSEIKGILACHGVPLKKQSDVIDEYLCFRCLSGNRTFFQDIKSLEPGICFEISESGIRSWRYWQPECPQTGINPEKITDKITETLYSAVKRQMVSDVPLGTLLSGGVDSGWVSAIAGKISSGLKTFTVGFHEEAYDETIYSKMVADSFNLDPYEIRIGNREFADTLPTAIWFHDEPLNHANSVQIYLICKFARNHVKVLLTGEGADELFAGYPRYFICRQGAQFLKLGPWSKYVVTHLLRLIPSRRIRKLSDFLGLEEKELIIWNARFSNMEKVAWLLDKESIDIPYRTATLDNTFRSNLGLIDNLLLVERQLYLQSILMRQDKLSMAASIESRVPMLDNEMVTLAESIPAELKLRRFQPKYLLKKAAATTLPSKVIYKRKVGFGVPIGDWLKDKYGMGRYIPLLLDTIEHLGGIKRNRIEKVITEHNSGAKNHEDILWPLINYAIWHEAFWGSHSEQVSI